MARGRAHTGRLAAVLLAGLAVGIFGGLRLAQGILFGGWPTTGGRSFSSRIIARGTARSRTGSVRVTTYEETLEYTVAEQHYYLTVQTTRLHSQPFLISYNPDRPSQGRIGQSRVRAIDAALLAAGLLADTVAAVILVRGRRPRRE